MNKAAGRQVPGVVVGNKTDLRSVAVVDSVEAADFAHAQGLSFVECSAVDNVNVTNPFEIISTNVCK